MLDLCYPDTDMNTYIYIYIYVCMSICMCIYVYMYVYMCIYMYILEGAVLVMPLKVISVAFCPMPGCVLCDIWQNVK